MAILLPAGAQAVARLAVQGAEFSIEIDDSRRQPDSALLTGWVREAADAVATYYGRFPARSVGLRIHSSDGSGISGGRAFAHRGAEIRIRVGAGTTAGQFRDDWMLVHEMTHLAFPSVSDRHHWLEEGLATYVESIARAQAGQLTATEVWSGFVAGMPNGLPRPGDRGLDHTPTWGRTYWGGALFCLLADVEIRQRTGNRRGLQDALRAILAYGNMETSSALAPLLEIGDRAVGEPVLSELYRRMKDSPAPTDLQALCERLGIEHDGRAIRFNEAAPDAAIRRAITATRDAFASSILEKGTAHHFFWRVSPAARRRPVRDPRASD